MVRPPDHDSHGRWADFRFAVIAPLLVAPPDVGELQARIRALAQRSYQHPLTGEPVKFGFSTIERWYYMALRSDRPTRSLRRKPRKDAGHSRVWTSELIEALRLQYRQHPGWSVTLHRDNLQAQLKAHPEWGHLPSYASVHRLMKKNGWIRRSKTRAKREEESGWQAREVRGFEHAHAHALWHLDFHQARIKIADAKGRLFHPKLVCILDDATRLCCHLQWYHEEEAEALIHALSQALLKRGIPRALMTDNGGAMLAAETVQGLKRLSIQHRTTLPYSPHQNGKQEHFWTRVEGRLMPVLEDVEIHSLRHLTHMTMAWAEHDYHFQVHGEMGCTPLQKLSQLTSVARPAPEYQELREAFTQEQTRVVRRSDATISVHRRRFEVPHHLSFMDRLVIRFKRWDLSRVYVVDPAQQTIIATLRPQEKNANASGARRCIDVEKPEAPAPDRNPALLQKWMEEYAASGMPPAFFSGQTSKEKKS